MSNKFKIKTMLCISVLIFLLVGVIKFLTLKKVFTIEQISDMGRVGFISILLLIVLLIALIIVVVEYILKIKKMKKHELFKIGDDLAEKILSNEMLLILISIVILGFLVHSMEWGFLNGNDNGHSTIITTFIGSIIGIVTIVGFLKTADMIRDKSEKIDDYRVFYKACIDIIEESSKRGSEPAEQEYELIFSGGTIIPGAFFEDFKDFTSKKKKDGYYGKFNDFIKNLEKNNHKVKFILPLITEDDFRCKAEEYRSNHSIEKSTVDNAIEEYKEFFQPNVDCLKKMEIGVVTVFDDIIDYYYMSNGKSMVFATTLNTTIDDKLEQSDLATDTKNKSSKLPPIIIGIKSDNPVLIHNLNVKFNNLWKELERQDLILKNCDAIRNFGGGGLPDDITVELKRRLSKRVEDINKRLSTFKDDSSG